MPLYLWIQNSSPKVYPLNQDVLRVGSASYNEISLPEEINSILPEHLKIVPVEYLHYLLLCNSSENPILLNGQQVTSSKIQMGDVIVLGKTEIQVQDRGEIIPSPGEAEKKKNLQENPPSLPVPVPVPVPVPASAQTPSPEPAPEPVPVPVPVQTLSPEPVPTTPDSSSNPPAGTTDINIHKKEQIKIQKRKRNPWVHIRLFVILLFLRFSTFTVSLVVHCIVIIALMFLFWMAMPEPPQKVSQVQIHLASEKKESLPKALDSQAPSPQNPPSQKINPSGDLVKNSPALPNPIEASKPKDLSSSMETPVLNHPDVKNYVRLYSTENKNAFGAAPFSSFGNRGNRGTMTHEGGSALTESAIDAALDWLKRHQDADGSWKSIYSAPPKSGCIHTSGTSGTDVALTGLALLCFLGNGNTYQSGKYKEVVQKALLWLKRRQVRIPGRWEGIFALHPMPQTTTSQQPIESYLGESFMYGHAIAAFAVCEAYGMTNGGSLKDCARLATEFCYNSQNPGAGWRYSPGDGCGQRTVANRNALKVTGNNDTSVTGWFVLALGAAQKAKLYVPWDSRASALNWLDSVTDASGNTGYDRKMPRISTTAIAVLCRQFLLQTSRNKEIEAGCKIILEALQRTRSSIPNYGDIYTLYYATYAIFQRGGSHWNCGEKLETLDQLKSRKCTCWNHAMQYGLIASQVDSGCEKGSWEYRHDAWGNRAGRVYTTTLSVLTLEVYYRYDRWKKKK